MVAFLLPDRSTGLRGPGRRGWAVGGMTVLSVSDRAALAPAARGGQTRVLLILHLGSLLGPCPPWWLSSLGTGSPVSASVSSFHVWEHVRGHMYVLGLRAQVCAHLPEVRGPRGMAVV